MSSTAARRFFQVEDIQALIENPAGTGSGDSCRLKSSSERSKRGNNNDRRKDCTIGENQHRVKTAIDAKATVTTAQDELVSKSKEVGLLLLEAKKLHPAVKDFNAFLKKVQGLSLSWAYDLLRLAGGRTTEEELKKDARERKQKSRANKKKLPTPAPQQTLLRDSEGVVEKPDSVTVTESPEASAGRRRAENADLGLTAEEKAARQSAHYLAEFSIACRTYLPKITIETDRQKARLLVSELTSIKPKMRAA
jgi:hypothetical protein